MQYELDNSHDRYIRVTVTGILDRVVLMQATSELVNLPEYAIKHALWDLREAAMGLTFSDLKEIVGVLRLYKPGRKDFADKSAILVPGRMNRAMADIFVSLARSLPFKYRVFSDVESALDYLSS